MKRKPEYLIDTFKDLKNENARKRGYTLVITFSRSWCLHNFFANLNHMKIDLHKCHCIIIDNTVFSHLKDELIRYSKIYSDVFKSFRLVKTYEPYGGVLVYKIKHWSNEPPINHIFRMHELICKLVKTKRFVVVEDDTLPSISAIPRLMKILKENKNCGIAVGIETSQAYTKNTPTRMGLHYIKSNGNRLLERLSLPNDIKGIKEVDACGLYCTASYIELWKEAMNGIKKDLGKIPHFAMDSMLTNYIKKKGYKILVDCKVNCKHMTNMGKSIYFSEKKQAIPMVDIYQPQYDVYTSGLKIDWDNRLKKHWGLK